MSKAEYELDRNGYKAPAVHKAFELLRAVAEAQGGARLVDLATRAGISTSTAHGLVHALLREKALVQGDDPRRLFLGPLIADLAFTDWNYIKVNRLGQPIINELRDRVEATVFLGVRVRGRIMITATAEAKESFKISAPVGTTMPLCAGAVGKVFLALEKSPEQISEALSEKGLPQFTPNSITNLGQYLDDLDRVRSQGFAIDDEEYLSGIRAVAVALKNRRGLPMAIWIVGIASSMGLSRLQQVAEMSVHAAKELCSRLDGIGRTSFQPGVGGHAEARLAPLQADSGPAPASTT
ncbi:MAG: IclR family transcriptional regulator [Syntrophobacteraceae bacterium]|nr:IclR family transcriptional regulator [Syntrophobacteraceae bacterium]